LRKCDTLEKAVFEFGRLYEAPAGTTSTHLPGFKGRLDYAKQALAAIDAPVAIARALRDGMTGEDVRALQQALLRNGYRVDIDGAFGPRTERAVMDYQRDHQMKVDGLAGPLTLAALNGA
jgi:peptidoglycan hydrolase-like protein with peptidoglycan-binding domain